MHADVLACGIYADVACVGDAPGLSPGFIVMATVLPVVAIVLGSLLAVVWYRLRQANHKRDIEVLAHAFAAALWPAFCKAKGGPHNYPFGT